MCAPCISYPTEHLIFKASNPAYLRFLRSSNTPIGEFWDLKLWKVGSRSCSSLMKMQHHHQQLRALSVTSANLITAGWSSSFAFKCLFWVDSVFVTGCLCPATRTRKVCVLELLVGEYDANTRYLGYCRSLQRRCNCLFFNIFKYLNKSQAFWNFIVSFFWYATWKKEENRFSRIYNLFRSFSAPPALSFN